MFGLRVCVCLVLESTSEHLVFLHDVSSSIHAAAQRMSPWGRRDRRQVTSIRLHKSETDVLSDSHTHRVHICSIQCHTTKGNFLAKYSFYIITLHTDLDMNLQQDYKEKKIPQKMWIGHSEGFPAY